VGQPTSRTAIEIVASGSRVTVTTSTSQLTSEPYSDPDNSLTGAIELDDQSSLQTSLKSLNSSTNLKSMDSTVNITNSSNSITAAKCDPHYDEVSVCHPCYLLRLLTMKSYCRRHNVAMKSKQKNQVKISSQCFFLILAVLVLVYVGLVSNLLSSEGEFNDSSREYFRPSTHEPAITRAHPKVSLGKSDLSVPHEKPKLEKFIQGWNVTGNVNWLLDFAIVGFPKTGTSTLMHYLQNQTQSIFIFTEERCELGWNQHVPLMIDLHRNYEPYLRMGIKCPRDLEVDLALKNYKEYFPNTKFIVGVRHPIRWFESFYNFRVQNGFPMPAPQRLIGKCRTRNHGLCTVRANFSEHLKRIESSRKVFLYEVSQLKDPDSELGRNFRTDLGRFLEVKDPILGTVPHFKPGLKTSSTELQQDLDANKIDICDDQYNDLRELLRTLASDSATWIQDVFLKNPNVSVSSQEHFKLLLQHWHSDPCEPK
jgi:hypothetical protein